MAANPAIVSEGVLWASTPLFAAAHLWPWHPLLATGIWTAYGIVALFPQGEALLAPLAESPLRYNYIALHSSLHGHGPGVESFEAQMYQKNETTNNLATPNASSSKSASTTKHTRHEHVVPFTTPGGQPTSSDTRIQVTVMDSRPAPIWSTPCMSTNPSATSDLELYKYPAPIVTNGQLRTWSADVFRYGALVLFLASCASFVRKLIRRSSVGKMTKKSAPGTYEPEAVPSRSPEQHTAPKTSATESAGSLAPASWDTYILWHVRRWTRHCALYWRHLKDALIISKAKIGAWYEDFAWLAMLPLMRIVAAASVFAICMYLTYRLLGRMSVADRVAWAMIKRGFQTPVPPSGSPLSSSTSVSTVVEALHNAVNTITDPLRLIKYCTTCAFNTSLNPDSTYETFLPPPTWTGAICKFVFDMVMSFRSIPLALPELPLKALKRCFDAAWTNPMSSSGTYSPAHHSGPAASLCSNIEVFVMSARSFRHFPTLYLAPLYPIAASAGRVPELLSWTSQKIGSLLVWWRQQCCGWIYLILTPIILSAVFTLNTFVVPHWPAPRLVNTRLVIGKMAALSTITRFQHFFPLAPIIAYCSPDLQPATLRMLVTRTAHKGCLLLVPAVLLVWYCLVTPSRVEENWVFVVSPAVILCCARELVEPKWNALLQWLGIAPRGSNIVYEQDTKRRKRGLSC